ncbi:hypothetical protein CFP65_7639 [Kitasatospora sp. MMS16-BH015]|uniref:DUF6629 family protein n=1 Tax=Kitasatospora sp. MMS16-BH015 TaxID=2018025 RepID=UPI000CA3000C|nr:DUF6629 family protein [Kitasatospora sp. MMS16-BH015]AUG82209.1 hypothetical protein CFP65_7639 [Kitasatospora sp. MMS16-BH015]
MCWSAEADLVAGTVVAGLGVWCLAGVQRARDVPLAALPLLLGVHQLIEALVWWGVDRPAGAGWAVTAWAVIALPVLPLLVSAGVWCSAGPPARTGPAAERLAAAPRTRSADRDRDRDRDRDWDRDWDRDRLGRRIRAGRRVRLGRRVRAGLALLGAAVCVLLAIALATRPVTVEPHGHTLRYGVGLPYAAAALAAGYLLTTVGALLCAADWVLRLLGALVGLGAALCLTLYRLAFVSTWCALSALAALILLRWVRRPLP